MKDDCVKCIYADDKTYEDMIYCKVYWCVRAIEDECVMFKKVKEMV